MYKKKKFLFLIIIGLIIVSGCSTFNANQAAWDNLPDRKFYLTEFQYIHIDKNSTTAREEMKNFPVKKIMYIIARGYNVEIDMSDYYRFISTGNSSEIKTEGFIRNEKFTWSSKNKDVSNRVRIVFEKDYFDESKMKFTLYVTSGDKNMKSMAIEFSKIDTLYKQLGFYITGTDVSIAEYEQAGYDVKPAVPGLLLGDPSAVKVSDSSKISQIKDAIDEYVKTLDSEQKKSFKHDIIDHIYKICE